MTDESNTKNNCSSGALFRVVMPDDGGNGANFRISQSLAAGACFLKIRGYNESTTGDYRLEAAFANDG